MAGEWFVGEHERQLDPKGRVALPVDFRPWFEPLCYLTIGEAQCIVLLTADQFEADARETVARQRAGEISRNELRAKAARTVPVKVDAQGRIHVPDKLRAYAGLELDAPVLISGAYERVEMWQPERFDAIEAAGTMEIAGTTT